MDIKDSYLHGTVGVVKSISVSADTLKYKLADVTGTVKEVTLPVATQKANGLMSSTDKDKLDAFNYGSLKNNLVLKIESGTTEGTDQYTYNGSGAKALNIKSGPGIRFTTAPGSLQIYNSGVISIDTGKTNGTISVNTNGTSEDVAVKGLGSAAYTSSDYYVKWDGTSTAYYNISQKSNNSEGHVRAIFYDKDGNSVFGYGYNSSNKQAYITNYTYGKDLYLGNGILTYGGRTVAFIDSDITGNAATADKLKSKVKLWGLDFDGSSDVKGNMTGVGTINHNFKVVNTQDNNATLNVESTVASSAENYIHLYVNSNSGGSTTRPLVLQHNYGNVGIGVSNPTYKLEVNGNVKATSFIGNLDGKYVNKLTDYTKATSPSAISNNDSLNKALGKLEYKADTAYDWYKSVTGTDNDDIINKWEEIVDFIDSVKEGTDITDEFVTRKTNLDVTGKKTFINSDGTYFRYGNNGIRLIGSDGCGYLQLGLITGDGTKTHKGKITGISAQTLTSLDIAANASTFSGTVTATKFITVGGTSSLFVKGDGSLDSTVYLHSGNYTNHLPFLNSTTVHATKDSIIYAPSKGGSKGLLLSSNGSSEPIWQNVSEHGIHWEGFTRRAKADCTWGSLTSPNGYTPVFWLNCELAALGFSTANNMLHMLIDGYFYQNEGRYKLTDVTETVTELGTEANLLTWKKNGVTNKITIPAADRLNSKVIKKEVTVTVNNTKWTDVYTFSSEVTGTYAIQIIRSDLVASGIMSFYNGVADSIGDEIPLHVYGNATWRPYLRTYNKKLLISSNDAVDTSRSNVTIKIAQIL